MAPADKATVIFRGAHEYGATAITFSPDGSHLLSGGHAGDVSVWDMHKQQWESKLKLHTRPIRAIAVANQSLFATTADDGRIVLWNKGKTTSQATGAPATSLIRFQDKLVSGHADKLLRVWDWSLQQITQLEFEKGIEAIAAHGNQLAVALPDQIMILDADLKIKQVFDTGGITPHDLQFSPDGKRLAAGGWFRLHVWDLASGEHRSIATEHGGLLTSVSFSPDGNQLVSLGRHTDSAIRIVDATEFAVLRRYQAHELCGAMIRYSPDGHWLASASDDESIRLYDLTRPYQPSDKAPIGGPSSANAIPESGRRVD